MGFDFERALERPVRIMNDAAMQALGSYKQHGKILFLGLGTGLGSSVAVHGTVRALELGTFPYRKKTIEDYVSRERLKSRGAKKWSKDVAVVVAHMINALSTLTTSSWVEATPGSSRKFQKVAVWGAMRMHSSAAFVCGKRLKRHRGPERHRLPARRKRSEAVRRE